MVADNRAPVTVLGLGPMGQALARAFLTNGHPTTVWNRTAAKADDLVAQGAVRADTVADAVTASPLVIVCVIDYAAAHAILDPASDVLTGRALVNLTADTPARARDTAAWAAGHGIDYLDGAIMSPTDTIAGPAAVVFYSGPEALYLAHQPTLTSLGGTAGYLGPDPGRAAAHDVALLGLFWTSMAGLMHAFALAGAEHIAATELAPFAQGLSSILPGIIAEFAAHLDEDHYPGEKSNILSAAAGMEHVIHASQAHNIDTSVLRAAKSIAQRAIDAGHGTDSFARLAEMLRQVRQD